LSSQLAPEPHHQVQQGCASGIHFVNCTGLSGFVLWVVFELRVASATSRSAGRPEPSPLGHVCPHRFLRPSTSLSSSARSRSPPRRPFPADRVLPQIPAFSFIANALLLNLDPNLHEMPLEYYHRQRVRRAVGAIPANTILPPLLSSPVATPVGHASVAGQYKGDIAAIAWNSQALFAADCSRHQAKSAYVHKLMAKADVGLFSEVHGTEESNSVWHAPHGTTAWWSQGPTRGHAGLGIVVKNAFLAKFNPNPQFIHLWRGRAALLRLDGPEGSLDIVAAYFHTGSSDRLTEHDLHGLSPAERQHVHSYPASRRSLRCRIARGLRSQQVALTLLGGDFNYVTSPEERVSLTTAEATGRRDTCEERHFQQLLGQRFELVDMYQQDHTHASATSRARLDRIYMNQHVSE